MVIGHNTPLSEKRPAAGRQFFLYLYYFQSGGNLEKKMAETGK